MSKVTVAFMVVFEHSNELGEIEYVSGKDEEKARVLARAEIIRHAMQNVVVDPYELHELVEFTAVELDRLRDDYGLDWRDSFDWCIEEQVKYAEWLVVALEPVSSQGVLDHLIKHHQVECKMQVIR